MKKIFTIAAAVMLTTAAYAQTKGNVELGFNVGYNSSTVNSNEFWGTPDYNQSFNIGASVDYYFSDRWSIKGKLIYDRKGWDNGGIIIDGGIWEKTDYNLDYVTIPVMANWHFGSSRNWYLHFGPYIGFLMNAKDTEFDTDIKEGFNTFDAGIALGIGVKIPLNDKLKLFFELDGQGGMSDIVKDNEGDRVTNSRSSINVGLNFLLQ